MSGGFGKMQALQFPLLVLWKDKGELEVEETSELDAEKVAIASGAAKGGYE